MDGESMKVIVSDEASWTACQKSLNDAIYADPDGEEEIYFQFPDGTARKITVEVWNRDHS